MFFKNKNRNAPIEKYIPNYISLNRNPVVCKVPPEDWRYAKEKSQMKRNKQNRMNITNNPVKIKGGFSQNVIPNSGQNSEHLWVGQQTKQFNQNDYELQEPDKLEKQEQILGKEKIYAQNQSSNKNTNNLSILDIPEFQFGIYVRDTLVHITESVEEVETAIEFLLFNESSPFDELEFSEISIVEKIPFKYGISVSKTLE